LRENDARSTWVRFGSESRADRTFGVAGRRCVRDAGWAGAARSRPRRRHAAARCWDAPVRPVRVSYDSLYRAPLGLLVTQAAVVTAVSAALGAADPVKYGTRRRESKVEGATMVS
jgi:hypothetical protein